MSLSLASVAWGNQGEAVGGVLPKLEHTHTHPAPPRPDALFLRLCSQTLGCSGFMVEGHGKVGIPNDPHLKVS